jgi:hypothetical protein
LAIFALVNLVFWVGAAVIIGLVASDRIDLGLESFIRQQQAAMVAGGEDGPAQYPTIAILPDEGPTRLARVDDPGAGGTEATLPPPSPTVEMRMTPYTNQPMTPYATEPASPGSPPTPVPTTAAPSPPPTAVPSQPTPASSEKAMAAPPSSPMLLSDPTAQELMNLDAEVRASAAGRPIQIRYGEESLNQEIATLLATAPDVPYRNVWAELQSNRVVLTGDISIASLDLPTKVEGRVIAANCQPAIQLESVSIGGLLTPAFVKEEVVTLIQDALNWYPPDYPLCLEQIVLEEGRATVYGSVR